MKIALYSAVCVVAVVVLCFFASDGKREGKLTVDLDLNHPGDVHLDKNVTVLGTALNAKEGAIIEGKRGMVIIDGIDRWVDPTYGKRVSFSGRIFKKTWAVRKVEAPPAAVPSGTFYYLSPVVRP
jgi:hypothetical protein